MLTSKLRQHLIVTALTRHDLRYVTEVRLSATRSEQHEHPPTLRPRSIPVWQASWQQDERSRSSLKPLLPALKLIVPGKHVEGLIHGAVHMQRWPCVRRVHRLDQRKRPSRFEAGRFYQHLSPPGQPFAAACLSKHRPARVRRHAGTVPKGEGHDKALRLTSSATTPVSEAGDQPADRSAAQSGRLRASGPVRQLSLPEMCIAQHRRCSTTSHTSWLRRCLNPAGGRGRPLDDRPTMFHPCPRHTDNTASTAGHRAGRDTDRPSPREPAPDPPREPRPWRPPAARHARGARPERTATRSPPHIPHAAARRTRLRDLVEGRRPVQAGTASATRRPNRPARGQLLCSSSALQQSEATEAAVR